MCRSWYSLMSSRTMRSSLPKSASARARASSVLPTPVGPRKRKLPIGRSGSASPARERSTASATAATASSCPTTRSCSCSSRPQQPLLLLLGEAADRDAGLPGDDLGDVLDGRPRRRRPSAAACVPVLGDLLPRARRSGRAAAWRARTARRRRPGPCRGVSCSTSRSRARTSVPRVRGPQPYPGAGLVHQVDRLVGQVAGR